MKQKLAVIGLKGLPAYGGAAAVGENLIEHLKDEFEITVYSTSSHTNLKTGPLNGFKQIVFNKIKNKKLNTLLYYCRSAIHAFFRCNYDVIHLHHRDAAFILPLLRLRGYKTITTLHGTRLTEKWAKYEFFFNIQDWILVKFSHKITSVSPIHYSKIINKTKKHISYIPNGIKPMDTDWLPNKIDYSNYLVFAAGRIVPSKGCHTFLKAAKKLQIKRPILIIGDVDQLPEYKKELLKLSEGLQVSFIGLVKNKSELFSYFKNASLFVYPSSIEAMSMILLEAASVKVPIICSDIPENKNIFSQKQVSFFKVDDVEDLCKVLKSNLSDQAFTRKKAEIAFEYLIQNYRWEDISESYLTEIQNIKLKKQTN